MKRKYFILTILLSICASGGYSQNKDSSITVHIELALKLNAGPNIFVLNHSRSYEEYSDISQHIGYFGGGGLQLSFVGKKSYSFLIDAGYSFTSSNFDYVLKHQGLAGGYTDTGKYSLNIKKTELGFMSKHFLNQSRNYYIDYGFYYAFEDSKIANGNMKSSYNSYNTVGSHSEQIFAKQHFQPRDQVGFLAGAGYSHKLKNSKTVFIDLRINFHNIFTGTSQTSFRQLDFCFSLGYIFYSGKGKTIKQKSDIRIK